jgi:hypothetical protein
MPFGTYKPCPGCGEKTYRAATSVCDGCKELLRLGRAVQESGIPKEDGALYRLTSEWPHLYYPSDSDSSPELRKDLTACFLALAQASLRRAKTRVKPYDKQVIELPPKSQANYFSTYDEDASVLTGSPKVAKAIIALDGAVREAVMDAYHSGERSGQNLLKQIAGGNVTIAQLTEAQIEAGRRKGE